MNALLPSTHPLFLRKVKQDKKKSAKYNTANHFYQAAQHTRVKKSCDQITFWGEVPNDQEKRFCGYKGK